MRESVGGSPITRDGDGGRTAPVGAGHAGPDRATAGGVIKR
ncbi:hypothetical protein [Nocardia paucivorans]|nr:hypothetical protein [Nocardia paucivorans]